jgi:hypothetical protein
MASRKGKKVVDARPSLSEVRAQPGKYVFITYEGTEGGGWGLPAPRPRFVGDVTESLIIMPFEPKQIGEEWLDDPHFVILYEKIKGIKIWRSDVFPERVDLTLPDELEARVSKYRQAVAMTLVMGEYDEHFKDVIQVRSMDIPESDAVRFDHSDVLPFLKVIQFYESRLLKRPEVLEDIKKRLRVIIASKAPLESEESL